MRSHNIWIGIAMGGVGIMITIIIYALTHRPSDMSSTIQTGTQQETAVSTQQQTTVQTQHRLCFDSTCFAITIADNPITRQQGLMHRTSLPVDEGMLFVFDQAGQYAFWMKNTLIPLDIIRFDQDWSVLDIVTAQPCTQDPCPTYEHTGQAKYALEINGGLAEKYGIIIGAKATRK